MVDLVAGTSTSGILACYYSFPRHPIIRAIAGISPLRRLICMPNASDENIRQLKDAGACFIKEHVEELDEIVKNVL